MGILRIFLAVGLMCWAMMAEQEVKDADLKIMTSDGKIQYVEKAVREKNKPIEIKNWPQGIYFVLVKSNNKMVVKTVNVIHY